VSDDGQDVSYECDCDSSGSSVFDSFAANLVPEGDTNDKPDVYVERLM
jgi:hypothetical protein